MFRTSSCPTPGATTAAVAASGLPSELGDSSAVGRGSSRPARPQPTAKLSPSSDGKPEAATAVVVAPDVGHEDARNMLSCTLFKNPTHALCFKIHTKTQSLFKTL